MNAQSTTRAEAVAAGHKSFFPGTACSRGHVSERYVSNSNCGECLRSKNREYQSAHRARLLERKREWARLNPELNRAQSSRWSKENREKANISRNEWRARNPQKHLSSCRIQALRRRGRFCQPAWANVALIKQVYIDRPDGMEVDHIIPIMGKTVCGLHVHYNLQYLTKGENSRKGNRWEA